MLASQKTSKKKIIIYAVIILAMIIGNFIIYYSNTDKIDLASDDDFISALDGGLDTSSAEDLSLGQSVLEHNVFISLKKIGDWPVVPTNLGKADPFAHVCIVKGLLAQSISGQQ